MSERYKVRDPHGLQFITCTIVGWVDLFSRQVYRDIVLDSWRYCQQHKGLKIHAYTIMSNHIHMIVSCSPPFELQDVMRDWKHFTARKTLEYLKNPNTIESRRTWLLYLFSYLALGKKDKQTYQVWQHEYHPVALYTEAVIAQKLEYIHMNAVRAGLVAYSEQWRYSSAPFYAANSERSSISQDAGADLIEITPVWQAFYDDCLEG